MARARAAVTVRSPALAALLREVVDYAGLFPPAALGMAEAVARYASYRAGTHRAMLGRFVVPVGRLAEFAAAARPHWERSARDPWPLSVLAGAADAPAHAAFARAHAAHAVADVVEAKAATAAEVGTLASAFPPGVTVYVEVPVRDDPAPLLAAVRRAGLRAKIRTGGVTSEAFPTAAEVARFLAACVALDLPFKATAGLHHPLRGEFPLTYAPDAPRGTMFGFLNIFLTAALLRGGAPAEDVAPLLEERDPRAIAVSTDAITWRGHRITTDALAAARAAFAGSFGSCSFEEPVTDLQSLQLL
jgi:hypothetical protein